MLLTSIQAAEKLGISVGQVKTLIKNGLLKDHAKIKEGAKKHYFKVDSKELNEYKSNGKVPRARTAAVTTHEAPSKGFNSRLESIERKLDVLIAIWK